MWQFLKRWRKAYLEDKIDRERAETSARCDAAREFLYKEELFQPKRVDGGFDKDEDCELEKAYRDATRMWSLNKDEKELWW
ncbi:hypothetical protein AAFX24_17930 [Vibrio mediterranei]|uniref:hypothetical protein n=1 Tax=Vibrio mediterranei TaxID=689 RepID=UPI0038CEA30C